MSVTENEASIKSNSSFPRKREPRDFRSLQIKREKQSRWVPAFAGMTSLFFSGIFIGLVSFSAHAQSGPNVIDDFNDPSQWRVVASNQVSGSLRQVDGVKGKALCLDSDFNGVSGYAGLQRDVALEYPSNYQFDFQLRGDSPKNELQFKLVDASGENVWWAKRSNYEFPQEWTAVRYKQRHIRKAWGPEDDKTLRRSAYLEFTINNTASGRGSVCFDELVFQPLPVDDGAPLRALASATATLPGSAASNAVDGDEATAWHADFADAPRLILDLGRAREFGGVVLRWKQGEHASAYLLQLSDDGVAWRDARTVHVGNGGVDHLALPEAEARYLRLLVDDGPGRSFGLSEITLQPLSFAATPNEFIEAVAKDSPRGVFPRGFSGEQPYWTILGIDGGHEQGLIGEDGAIELGAGAPSIEPFVLVDGELVGWADVRVTQSLQEGYLPIPSVDWRHPQFDLRTTAFVQGEPGASRLVGRYRLSNSGDAARDYVLALALQPFQVNAPRQFLNVVGGVSRVDSLSLAEGRVRINGQDKVFAKVRPDAALASAFDAGMIAQQLQAGEIPSGGDAGNAAVEDGTGLASGAWLYRVRLQPGESREFAWVAPLEGSYDPAAAFDADQAQEAVAAAWRDKLDRVHIKVPPQGQALVDTLRTATAHMLVSRIGPRLQPGTRSYARSWIRDGAMISEGLLRMGRAEVVRDYVEFYAPYQFDDGKVPCCVDDRGGDPVPENDSHGELIFNIAELYRYNGDKAFLAKMWPHVLGAYEYMEKLRLSERTEANRALNPAFYGMMPASISHEGYSAKPMHSYWDDFWALRGYKDAVEVAQWLGKTEEARRLAVSRDQFHEDLLDSLQAAVKLHDLDFLPGSAELGDFDATSTTIALAPGGEQGRLPRDLLENTFERYWREFQQRRDGKLEWKDYTPYEWRNVAAFVRLGWRERAWEAVQFFFKDRAPQHWNQWAEVVSSTPRTPFFVGDLPHAWVASDFLRSALDMFAYTREIDDSIVLAAGIPVDWFEGKGIAIRGLRTPNGKLGYSLRRAGSKLELKIDEGLKLPAGGLVLPWPYAGAPGKATVNGKSVAWKDGELRILSLPAKVSIEAQ